MVSRHTRPFTSHFADYLTEGDVFSVHRDGKLPVRVVGSPVVVKNLVGDRSHVMLKVVMVSSPGTTGQMILNPSSVIYIYRKENQHG